MPEGRITEVGIGVLESRFNLWESRCVEEGSGSARRNHRGHVHDSVTDALDSDIMHYRMLRMVIHTAGIWLELYQQ